MKQLDCYLNILGKGGGKIRPLELGYRRNMNH